ncbi:MAG: AMP-binding protein [Dehalococcoidales bacterium]|nr:AMP-binding protein [Dehalococcoidales bacterium]
MGLKLMLEGVAGRYGDKPAIISGERKLSFLDLDIASNKVAHALMRTGVSKGDRIALLLANSPEFVITFFGIVKAGAIAVPLNAKYKFGELSALLADAQPKVLITESPTLESLSPFLAEFKSIEQVIGLTANGEGKYVSYQDIISGSSAQRITPGPEPDDIALIAYTSGPSLSPGGVMLSHRSLVVGTASMAEGFRQTEKDISLLFSLPLDHMLGLAGVLLASIYKGSTLVMVAGTGLSMSSFFATIEKEKGTIFWGVPYTFTLATEMAEKEGIKNDLSSLRLCGSAGAPLSLDVIRRFKQYYGLNLIDGWGLTEAVCLATCQAVDGSGTRGSVGKALPGWEMKIVDETGRELPLNQSGEIIVRGPITKGYYNNPEATAEVIRDGWLYTGDIGKINEEGDLFITGRKKDLIIIKGQNVCPGDIESTLLSHPKVADAAAIGLPDRLRGEVVGVVISLKEGAVATEGEIKQFCIERMVNYKVPKQVIFIDSLPRTGSGSIDKESIRRRLAIPSIFPDMVASHGSPASLRPSS